MKLTKPWDIQLELTFGCDNRCPICFKQVLHKKKGDYDFMDIKTVLHTAKLLKKAEWDNIKVEYTFRGEPLLNPNIHKITKIFRKYLPNSQITCYTNGNNLNVDVAKKYFSAGGNIFLVDCYRNDLEKRKNEFKMFKVYDYYDDDFNPFHKQKVSTKAICLVDNIMKRKDFKITRLLDNRGGNIDYKFSKKFGICKLDESLNKKCTRPFRDITLLYNGDLVICCLDGNGDYKLGNINKVTDIKDFFYNNKKLNLARLMLYNKRRVVAPCKNCSYMGGMRQGLLPKMKILDDEGINKYSELIKKWSKYEF